ncbi:Uu.00g105200.m01.CDS01 [Anthostomella pinea]|uniref:Uu.00g105200.m01.CDS01 n=1 Tax=Anthostomella pinea TaxID=933095 RepID=A0AAI8VDR7_9PEZI|nr:Uu.00g105200.m01.CDS01 [Anthostomella pinea]
MAKDQVPTVGTLDKPESPYELLKQDRGEDCGSAFLGLAAYSYFSGQSQLEQQRVKILASKSMFGMRSRRFGIAATSMGLAWLGVYRLFV